MKGGDESYPQCVAAGGSMSGPAPGQRRQGGRHGKLPVPGNEPLHTPSTRTTVIELYYLCHGKIIPMYRPVITGNIGQFPLDRERSNEHAFSLGYQWAGIRAPESGRPAAQVSPSSSCARAVVSRSRHCPASTRAIDPSPEAK